jgi:hypothetical protein
LAGRLHHLLNPLDRQLGDVAGLLIAERGKIAAGRRLSAATAAHGLEAVPLLVIQRVVESLQRVAHDLHRLDHGIEPRLGRVEPCHRRQRNGRRA